MCVMVVDKSYVCDSAPHAVPENRLLREKISAALNLNCHQTQTSPIRMISSACTVIDEIFRFSLGSIFKSLDPGNRRHNEITLNCHWGVTISGRRGPLQDGKRQDRCHGRMLSRPFPGSRTGEGDNQHTIAETWFCGDSGAGEGSRSLQGPSEDPRKAKY